MKHLENLIDRIVRHVNIYLRSFNFDSEPYLKKTIPLGQFSKFYGFYGITAHHPIHFHFSHSNLAGSYLLGQCKVDNSILYKSDIRGDELKYKGDTMTYQDIAIPIERDEIIRIEDSFLIKNLVHNNSHDPEKPETFLIKCSAAMHYANIHGSPMVGCFLGPFSTVDLTALRDSIVGAFSYIQAGDIYKQKIPAGVIWVKLKEIFDFKYTFPQAVLEKYVSFVPGKAPSGMIIEFVEKRETEFQKIYDVVHLKTPVAVPSGASVNRYSVVKGQCHISENVLVAQRAYLEDAWMGKGANAQENCYISHSRLEGLDVTAHGAKIIHTALGKKVFVGFNAFLRGGPECPLTIGEKCIIMPHTLIDLKEPVVIEPETLVWGYITRQKDVRHNSLPIKDLKAVNKGSRIGRMQFTGSGARFVEAFEHRIEHILEANGAYFDGKKGKGHAQKGQNISFNIIQPYPMGPMKGLYPTIDINP
jgi:carbonic anhydrase/acetyltransferase-like protein (isoleucine patch superfamily)